MKLANRNSCTGCMACLQICPINCIQVKEDEWGNLFPFIDKLECITCGRCQSVCSELNREYQNFSNSKKCYAAWSIDSNIRDTSTSGGVAATLYRVAVNHGYIISGVEYNGDFCAIQTLTDQADKISAYQQSKYVYSDTSCVYKDIKNKLEQDQRILFISLPCKVAGLKYYLGKQYQNLITVDIVCHGTPPYKQMAEHILNIDKKHEAKKLSFRSDNEYIFKLTDDSSTTLYNKSAADDEYLSAFLNGLNYRDSCYHCQYAKPERISDLTICDFWGLGKVIPFKHPYSGAVSAVLVNTSKGEEFLSKGQEALFLEERPVNEAVEGNTQLRQPSQIHPNRDEFLREYPKVAFEKAVRICLKNEMKAARIKRRKKQCKSILRTAAGFIVPRYRN